MCLLNAGMAVANILGIGLRPEAYDVGLIFAGFFLAHAYVYPVLCWAAWKKESKSKLPVTP